MRRITYLRTALSRRGNNRTIRGMDPIVFDGQQSDERILSVIAPHRFARFVAVASIVTLAFLFLAMVILIGNAVPQAAAPIQTVGTVLCILFFTIGLWFTNVSYAQDRTYITDRRIIRFDTTTPFFHTKRALFWGEALKAKAFAPNLLFRMMNIGTLVVEPVMGEGESVRVTDAAYYEDLANYIDKILYITKNNPAELSRIKPFIPKPKGKRDAG